MLQINSLSKSYSGKYAVKNVTLTINEGEIIGLFGENGAGKTTLMKAVLGLVDANNGEILIDGEKLSTDNIDKVAFATCEHSFFGGLNAKEHITFYEMMFPHFNKKRFDTLMDFFELPYNKKIKSFSVGQQNQFETIVALSQGAKYIFMDEPFAGSDIFNRDDFYKVLLAILQPTETIILSTHLIEEVKNFIGRAILIHKGEIIGDKTTDEIQESDSDLVGYLKQLYSYNSTRVADAIKKNLI